jgi:multiple antibiotic resistance protein
MDLFLLMLVILNPFSQILYLKELMDDLTFGEFVSVHFKASVLSWGVFALFALVGDFLLHRVFQVHLEALQIFGGLVLMFIAYQYITVGPGSNLLFRGKIADLAPAISLPYMVGAGTLWVSIEMSNAYGPLMTFALVAGVLVINTAIVLVAKAGFHALAERGETILGKYMAILMRTMALFIGAVAVEMIINGIRALITTPLEP